MKIRSMYGSKIAHDALQSQGVQSQGEALCAYSVGVERFESRV